MRTGNQIIIAKRGLAGLALALLAVVLAPGPAAGSNLILTGGAIYTLDPHRPWASALVVENGHIAYVGNDETAKTYRSRNSRLFDLHGRMVLPGFHDAHLHPMSGAMRLMRCSFADSKTAEQLYASVRACASAKAQGEWLIGYGWAESLAPLLTRAKLDELVPVRPAFLTTADGYKAWVNSKALAISGIDPQGTTPQREGINRDSRTRRPTGVLEGDATNLIRQRIPPPTGAEYRGALRRATAIANRYGITSMFDAAATPAMVDAYHAADLAGELTVRVVAAQWVDPKRGVEQIDEMLARRNRARGRRFRADAAKIFLDEEIQMHTAALISPYADKPGSRGEMLIEPAALDAIVRRLDAEGFLIHMHAMGDGAVRTGLDAIELAMRTNGPRDRRHQLAHIGVASPDDIPRFGKLGVAANLQPLWFPADDPAAAPTEAVLGPDRSRWIMPMASIARAGGRIVAGSDWPATSMNPLESIQAAITRQPLDGSRPPRQPQERVGLAAMLAAYTRDAAWIVREDSVDGTIEVGKAADLVVLDHNLFNVRAGALHKVRILLTLLDGQPVYRDPGFAWN